MTRTKKSESPFRAAVRAAVPSDAIVRAQGVLWAPDQWHRRWPESLPKPPELTSHDLARSRPHVSRADVLARAQSVDGPDDAIALYLLMAAWGTGTNARPIFRSARPLHEPDVGRKLLDIHRAARDGSAIDAYRLADGDAKVKFFGPAFFTKWLYFSGHDVPRHDVPRPLIVDARVAHSLNALAGETAGDAGKPWPLTSWSADRYGEYLSIVAALRDELAPDAPAHVIEYALFQLAGVVPAQAHAA